MKKYSKIITIALCLTLIFTMFSGFMYAPVDVQNLASVTCSTCSGAGTIYGKCNDCPDCMDGSPCSFFPKSCLACGGTGSITVPDVTTTPKPTATPLPTPTPTATPVPTPTPTKKPVTNPAETVRCNNCLGYGVLEDNCHNCGDCMDGSPCPNRKFGHCFYCGGDGYVASAVVPTPKPTTKPIPDDKYGVNVILIDTLNYFNTTNKKISELRVSKGLTLAEFKTKYISTQLQNCVMGYYDTDNIFANYQLLDDSDIIHTVLLGSTNIYCLVDNINFINTSPDNPTDEVIDIVKKETVSVTYMNDGKIFKTVNVLVADVAKTQYVINPPTEFLSNRIFKGWGIAATATDVITVEYKPTANTTLHAIYETKETTASNVKDIVKWGLYIIVILVVVLIVFKIISFFRRR